jgi:hypothetical protein
MHDPANELRRISLPRTSVNKGIRKGRGLMASALPHGAHLVLSRHG